MRVLWFNRHCDISQRCRPLPEGSRRRGVLSSCAFKQARQLEDRFEALTELVKLPSAAYANVHIRKYRPKKGNSALPYCEHGSVKANSVSAKVMQDESLAGGAVFIRSPRT
jgi:hypothetical protein